MSASAHAEALEFVNAGRQQAFADRQVEAAHHDADAQAGAVQVVVVFVDIVKAGHGLKLRRRGDETGDFEAEAGHGGHFARAGEQAHLADAVVAQNLGADAVGARVPLGLDAG
jgi:hypothetical protein